mmetsp:Transcript_22873/g.37649  ORF Transcript_22873/g.37649 Transcript_22873/m.37649 type:complete len:162 (+) Transcript_22873:117-602(+)
MPFFGFGAVLFNDALILPVKEEFDVSPPTIKEGYLIKRSRTLKQWRKRYFILKGTKLYVFRERPIEERRGSVCPHSVIVLRDAFSVRGGGDHESIDGSPYLPKLPYTFELETGGDHFLLQCETSADREIWMSALSSAFIHSSNAFSAEDYEDYASPPRILP